MSITLIAFLAAACAMLFVAATRFRNEDDLDIGTVPSRRLHSKRMSMSWMAAKPVLLSMVKLAGQREIPAGTADDLTAILSNWRLAELEAWLIQVADQENLAWDIETNGAGQITLTYTCGRTLLKMVVYSYGGAPDSTLLSVLLEWQQSRERELEQTLEVCGVNDQTWQVPLQT